MLKTLSLSPDEIRDDSPAETPADNSETRMLRALEALSSAPQPRQPESHGQRDPSPFRANKPQQSRDNFRNDGPHHGNKARHRFVKDGEVPVVHMSPARPRDAVVAAPPRNDPEFARLHQLIEEQRQRAELAERTRNDALTQVKSLQTKLAHNELTLSDLQALAQSRLEELTRLQHELAQLRSPVAAAPADPGVAPVKRGPGRPRKVVAEAPLPLPPVERAPQSVPPSRTSSDQAPQAPQPPLPVKRGPGRPRRVVVDAPQLDLEPEPVQWWLLPTKQKRRG
jgi:hypothetical protein